MLVLAVWFVAWYNRTPPVPRSRIQPFSPGLKTALVSGMLLVALLVGYEFAMWRLEDHEWPIRAIFLIVTVFEAVTLVFCVEMLIYGAALTLSIRLRRLPAAQLNEPGR